MKATLKREFWRPDETKVLVRKQQRFGWGWTVNFAAVAAKFGRRSS